MTATPPIHPGDEPDPGDMATDPAEVPTTPELPGDEVEKLGDFA